MKKLCNKVRKFYTKIGRFSCILRGIKHLDFQSLESALSPINSGLKPKRPPGLEPGSFQICNLAT